MKKFVIIILILSIVGIGGIVGYHALSGSVSSGKTLTSDDNKFSMDIPASWNVTEKANDSSLFAAESPNASIYAVMSVKSMPNGYTVQDYLNDYIAQIAANSDDASLQKIIVEPQEKTYGENKGYYFELESTADGLPVHLRDFVFITMDGCVHIDVASSEDSDEDAAKAAEQIFSSVRYSAKGNVSQDD